ncbi:MAG: hypothetical protein Q9191_001651 [Dirinaria sp. TL-2023a]
MPPVRTEKKNLSTYKTNSLHFLGFTNKSRKNGKSKSINAKSKVDEQKDVKEAADLSVDGANLVAPSQIAAHKTGFSERRMGSVLKGVRDARFQDDRHNWNGKYHEVIGTATRKITFGYSFVLTEYAIHSHILLLLTDITRSSDHIDAILAIGPNVCGKLTDFIFEYKDTSYDAHNSASSLTDQAVVRLAKACPKLKKVQLQAADSLTDQPLLAFFEHCLNLTLLEITGTSRSSNNVEGSSLEALRQNPSWVPSLKTLLLPSCSSDKEKEFLKPVRDLTKARQGLVVKLVSVSETKKWGDWELEKYSTTYKKGRQQNPW